MYLYVPLFATMDLATRRGTYLLALKNRHVQRKKGQLATLVLNINLKILQKNIFFFYLLKYKKEMTILEW